MRATFCFCLAGTLSVLACTTQAQIGRADPAERFAQADANHDGRISREEFLAGREARFARADRNGDGYISDDDMPPFVRSNTGMMQKVHALEQAADLDGDGRVSRAEFHQAGERLFATVDTNHDGVIDHAEMDKAVDQIRALAGR